MNPSSMPSVFYDVIAFVRPDPDKKHQVLKVGRAWVKPNGDLQMRHDVKPMHPSWDGKYLIKLSTQNQGDTLNATVDAHAEDGDIPF